MAGITGALAGSLIVPASRNLAKRMASQLANVDEADFRKALDSLRGVPPTEATGAATGTAGSKPPAKTAARAGTGAKPPAVG